MYSLKIIEWKCTARFFTIEKYKLSGLHIALFWKLL